MLKYPGRIFVSYERESAWEYYMLMRAWRQTDGSSFDFVDMLYGNVDFKFDDAYCESVRLRLLSCGVFLLLLNDRTRFCERVIKCELPIAMSVKVPIIVMNLNGLRFKDDLRVPEALSHHQSVHIGFAPQILQHALLNWPDYLSRIQVSAATPHFYYYSDSVYAGVGL